MSSAKFTLIGCVKYYQSQGGDFFSNLTLPEGINKETLTNNILVRGGEFEVINGDPVFLHDMVDFWSKKYLPTLTRWVNALAIEYNPLENYDRMENWTDKTEGSGASSTNGTTARKNNQSTVSSEQNDEEQTNITDRDKFSSPPTSEHLRSAYDSSSYSPESKDVETGKFQTSNEITGNRSGSSAGSEDENVNMSESNSSVLNNDSEHDGRVHGNIGVTTSQQMLQQELDLGYWNIYEKATELFLQEFTIPVYF